MQGLWSVYPLHTRIKITLTPWTSNFGQTVYWLGQSALSCHVAAVNGRSKNIGSLSNHIYSIDLTALSAHLPCLPTCFVLCQLLSLFLSKLAFFVCPLHTIITTTLKPKISNFRQTAQGPGSGNTKGGSITVPLTSCLIGLDWSVLQIKPKIVSCRTADSEPVKQEVNGTKILPPSEFPARLVCLIMSCYYCQWPQQKYWQLKQAHHTRPDCLVSPHMPCLPSCFVLCQLLSLFLSKLAFCA